MPTEKQFNFFDFLEKLVEFVSSYFGQAKPKVTPIEPPKPTPPVTALDSYDRLVEVFVSWYLSQVGVREKGGSNRGPEVEMYQKTVDNYSGAESWCMAFDQTGLLKLCEYLVANLSYLKGIKPKDLYNKIPITKSEGCGSVWDGTPTKYKLKPENPKRGAWFIQITKGSWKGHTGVVLGSAVNKIFPTVEGNTDPGGSREGDGVYKRNDRSILGTSDKNLVGHIDVIQAVMDTLQTYKNKKA